MTDSVVELRQAQKSFGSVDALKPISLRIAPGEVLGLFGHNGAGKSTLMKLVLGVIAPSAGEVLALGHSPTANDSHHYRRQFGYLPENVSFYDQLSGREVLRYFAKLKGFDNREAERLLEEVGLAQAAGRAVKTYSKGMRQRLGLAQALLGDPRLLLLDEPTVGLDPVATSDFYATVDRLKSGGCAVILCSHVLPGVEAHIDRAMILSQGRALALGSLEELRNSASLPVEICVSGLSVEALRQQLQTVAPALLAYLPNQTETGTSENDSKLIVPLEEKLPVLRQVMSLEGLADVELRQPSLEEIYRCYITANGDEAGVNGPDGQANTAPPVNSTCAEGAVSEEAITEEAFTEQAITEQAITEQARAANSALGESNAVGESSGNECKREVSHG